MPGRHLLGCLLTCMTTVLGWAAEDVRVQGSMTAARTLRPLVSEAFSERYADVSLAWEGAGSGAAFTALLAGEADIGLSTRTIEEHEVELAAKLGLELRESVLALDGIAVVVHRGNDVPSLSLEQLESLYTARIVRWLRVGGIDEAVRLWTSSESSGIRATFRDLVFEDENTPFAAGAEDLVTEEDVLERVASDRGSVGFVSMTADRSSVRTVPIATPSGDTVLPSPATVVSGDYPLSYPLRLYMTTEPEGRLRLFLTFLCLHDGPRLLAEAGLAPMHAFTPLSRNVPPEPNRLSPPVRPGVSLTRVSFGFNGARLDGAARRELAEVARRVEASGEHLWITGHADPTEDAEDLSDARARAVADYLTERDVAPARLVVDGRGAGEPVASNAEPDRRRQNRRVDVWIVAP